LQKTISTMIVDKKYLLVVEYKDDANKDKCKSIEIATYSNSEATIMSYTSIIWIQSELQNHHVPREAKSRLSQAYKRI